MRLEATIRLDEADDELVPGRDAQGLAALVKSAAVAADASGFARDLVRLAAAELGVRRIAVLLAEQLHTLYGVRVVASKAFTGEQRLRSPAPETWPWKAIFLARTEFEGNMAAAPIFVEDSPVGLVAVEPAEHAEALAALLSIVIQRQRADRASRDVAAFHRDVLAALGTGVVATSFDGLVTAWNPKMQEVMGIPAATALGEPLSRLVMRAFRPPTCDPLLDALEGAQVSQAPMHLWRQPVVKADGTPSHLNMVVTPLDEGLALVIEDVSDRVALEGEMDHMRHMAQIGQLTAQIAHELRNPLTSIKGAAQLLSYSATDSDTNAFASIILQEVESLSAIADEFLDFARPTSLHLEPIDANNLLAKLASVWRGFARDRGVHVHVKRDARMPMIWMDAARMNQVLRNLILNAVQAMPQGGTLTLATRFDARLNDAVIRVRDTGIGMTDEQRARIFEPFFTTKAKGTGLGLSVVAKLVKAHGGHVAITTRPGKGTSFEIRLPAAEPAQ